MLICSGQIVSHLTVLKLGYNSLYSSCCPEDTLANNTKIFTFSFSAVVLMLACGKELFLLCTSGSRTIQPFQRQQNNKVAVIEEAELEKRI